MLFCTTAPKSAPKISLTMNITHNYNYSGESVARAATIVCRFDSASMPTRLGFASLASSRCTTVISAASSCAASVAVIFANCAIRKAVSAIGRQCNFVHLLTQRVVIVDSGTLVALRRQVPSS